MTWWKASFDAASPTWYGCARVIFLEAQDRDRAEAEAYRMASAEYPNMAFPVFDVTESTAERAAAFAEKQERCRKWLENSRTGARNKRGGL